MQFDGNKIIRCEGLKHSKFAGECPPLKLLNSITNVITNCSSTNQEILFGYKCNWSCQAGFINSLGKKPVEIHCVHGYWFYSTDNAIGLSLPLLKCNDESKATILPENSNFVRLPDLPNGIYLGDACVAQFEGIRCEFICKNGYSAKSNISNRCAGSVWNIGETRFENDGWSNAACVMNKPCSTADCTAIDSDFETKAETKIDHIDTVESQKCTADTAVEFEPVDTEKNDVITKPDSSVPLVSMTMFVILIVALCL